MAADKHLVEEKNLMREIGARIYGKGKFKGSP